MKRIQRSKEPSVRQMLNMARNLREKFGKASLIEIKTWAYSSSNNKPQYNLYVEDIHNIDFKTWKACQDKYFELMKK